MTGFRILEKLAFGFSRKRGASIPEGITSPTDIGGGNWVMRSEPVNSADDDKRLFDNFSMDIDQVPNSQSAVWLTGHGAGAGGQRPYKIGGEAVRDTFAANAPWLKQMNPSDVGTVACDAQGGQYDELSGACRAAGINPTTIHGAAPLAFGVSTQPAVAYDTSTRLPASASDRNTARNLYFASYGRQGSNSPVTNPWLMQFKPGDAQAEATAMPSRSWNRLDEVLGDLNRGNSPEMLDAAESLGYSDTDKFLAAYGKQRANLNRFAKGTVGKIPYKTAQLPGMPWWSNRAGGVLQTSQSGGWDRPESLRRVANMLPGVVPGEPNGLSAPQAAAMKAWRERILKAMPAAREYQKNRETMSPEEALKNARDPNSGDLPALIDNGFMIAQSRAPFQTQNA